MQVGRVLLHVRENAAYAKYFKMMTMGVPVPAVKMKMANEGLNPDLLDTPDAPFGGAAPPPPPPPQPSAAGR
jgi:Subunit CCDC53 of WASH complex